MKLSVAIVTILIIAGCGKKETAGAQVNSVSVKYTESTEDFPNPERGFYRYSQTEASNFTPLTSDQLAIWREELIADDGNYKVYSTLIFRYYEMNIRNCLPLLSMRSMRILQLQEQKVLN